LKSGATSCASSLSPIATPRPSSGRSTERREPASPRAPRLPRRRVRSYVRLRVWRQRSSIRRFRPVAADRGGFSNAGKEVFSCRRVPRLGLGRSAIDFGSHKGAEAQLAQARCHSTT
jgi:hypothetical protein